MSAALAYVLVRDPGTDVETVIEEFPDAHQARRAMRELEDDGASVDVMKRDRDGFLTTEF